MRNPGERMWKQKDKHRLGYTRTSYWGSAISKKLRAVHDDDLQMFLASIGVLKDIERGKLRCCACGTAVTRDNLYAVFPDSGAVRAACDQPDCVRKLTRDRYNS